MKRITITEQEVKTQRDAVLWHLATYKQLSSWQAIKEYGITRLASIIFNLREEGYEIQTQDETRKNRFGRSVTIAIYIYVEPKAQPVQTALF